MAMQYIPYPIIYRIVEFVSGGMQQDLSTWEEKLHLLSVCRNWRVLLKHNVYSDVYINVTVMSSNFGYGDMYDDMDYDTYDAEYDMYNSDYSMLDAAMNTMNLGSTDMDDPYTGALSPDDEMHFDVQTNIQLIAANGMESAVRGLTMCDYWSVSPNNPNVPRMTIFMSILAVLYSSSDEISGSSSLEEWLVLHSRGRKIRPQLTRACHAAAKKAAAHFVAKMPNIHSLRILSLSPHEFLQTVITELVSLYDRQLKRLGCDMPVCALPPLVAPMLDLLDLTVYPGASTSYPQIYSRNLKCAKVYFKDMEFQWDVFRYNPESTTVSFDNLEDLAVSFASTDLEFEYTPRTSAVDTFGMTFPNLRRLFIRNVQLTDSTMRAIVQPALRRVCHDGSLAGALQIANNPIAMLDELDIRWNSAFFPKEETGFVGSTNAIFSKSKGIRRVYFKLYYPEFIMDLTGINWMHLTHLELFAVPLTRLLLAALLRMPNLVTVTLDMLNEEGFLLITRMLLEDIRDLYSQPSSSKIEEFNFAGIDECLIHDFEGSPQLTAALQNLKWLLPRLEKIGKSI